MPICTFSNDYDAKNYTLLENKFITEYVAFLNEDELKVYLFGLFLCQNPFGEENSLSGVAKGTNMKPEKVKEVFERLASYGLVTIFSTAPLAIRFNSPSKAFPTNRTYNKDKYSEFVTSLQLLYVEKDLTESDIHAFVEFLEDSKMECGALLLIVQYCFDLKGKSINRNYILTVAKNWVADGCLTVSAVETRMFEVETLTEQIKQVLHALKSKRAVDLADRDLYLKWTRTLGFDHEAILTTAKKVKKGGMEKLDIDLENFAKQGIYSSEDIKKYASRREEIFDCTFKVVKRLGLFYEDCTSIAEEVIAPLFQKGFTGAGLTKIASYCHMNGIRDVNGFGKTADEFFRGGYTTDHSIDLQLDALTRFNESVEHVISATGSTRRPSQQDKDFYHTWSVLWGIPDETILKFAHEAQGRAYAMSWISNRLSELRENSGSSIFTPDPQQTSTAPKKKSKISDFEKAEIREKLLEDGVYATLIQKERKLKFEMSQFMFSGNDIPITMKEEGEQLKAQINERIKELGYNPEDLA